jgi:hypothetical protein
MELRSGAVTGLDGVASLATQESRNAAAAAKAAKATASAGKVDPRWCLIPQAGESHGDLEPGPHFQKVRASLDRSTWGRRTSIGDRGCGCTSGVGAHGVMLQRDRSALCGSGGSWH